MSNSQYREDAKKLLDLVGGEENIAAVTHCATRMRFALADEDKADAESIEDLPSVKGTFTNAGQFQVIIGNDVSNFYKEFEDVSGITEVSKQEVKDAGKSNQNWLQQALAFLGDVFTPIIPAFIVGGLILGFRNILEGIAFDGLGGQTIVETYPFWAAVNDFLWLPAEAIFHYLPVHITWSTVRKMGGTQVLGIILGITLVSPNILMNAYDAPAAIADGTVPVWDFGFMQVQRIGYQAQVLPALFTGLAYGWLEKFWRKVIPEYISMILVPFLSLLPAIILAHTILGPVGWRIGTWIGELVYAGLTSSASWLFGLVFGLLYAPLVITGLHHMTNAVDSQLVADFGGTMLWPMIALSNIAQGSATLAYWWLTRHDEKENQITIPSTISAYLGVTEPALFGVTLKQVYPFVAAIIGSGLAGLYSTLTQVTSNSIGVGGLPGFLVIQPDSMLNFFIAMAIAIIVPIVLTIVFNKAGWFGADSSEKQSDAMEEMALAGATAGTAATATETVEDIDSADQVADAREIEYEPFANVAQGEVIPIDEVEDEVFSQKMMGDGFAVRPSDSQVFSPVRAKVTNVFPTKHAIGLETDSGIEILIHMGLDTVELEGEPFEVFVTEGDTLEIGSPLAKMDLDAVKDSGRSTTIVVAWTNFDDVASFELDKTGNQSQAEEIGQFKVKE